MSVETSSVRKRKRIVEHTFTGFDTAEEAIVFGNTLEAVVADKAGPQKFRQLIGTHGSIAITKSWVGPTILKTCFLELTDNDLAVAIDAMASVVMDQHNAVRGKTIKLERKVIREKPLPQTIHFQAATAR